MTKPKKTGRPKSRRMQLLENKIAKLTKQIDTLESQGLSEIDGKSLTHDALSVIMDGDRYKLLLFKFSPEKGIGKLVETRDIGDARYRALFELDKYLAKEYKIK